MQAKYSPCFVKSLYCVQQKHFPNEVLHPHESMRHRLCTLEARQNPRRCVANASESASLRQEEARAAPAPALQLLCVLFLCLLAAMLGRGQELWKPSQRTEVILFTIDRFLGKKQQRFCARDFACTDM
jgi:hypothetical protein